MRIDIALLFHGVVEVVPGNYEIQISTNHPTASQPSAYVQVDVRNPKRPPGKRLISRQIKMRDIPPDGKAALLRGRSIGNDICKELE